MPTIAVTGSKGGCGASLVATNLSLTLASLGEVLLMDLHLGDGDDDLLLDVKPERSWADLLRVAGELTPRHIELAAVPAGAGMSLLAAPPSLTQIPSSSDILSLVRALTAHTPWLVLDLPARAEFSRPALSEADVILITITGDPPAIRAAQRLIEALPEPARARCSLVFNQFTRAHPAHPQAVAALLGCPLAATLPVDPRAVGFQVSFGRPSVFDRSSRFGQSVARLAHHQASRLLARQAAA